MSTETHILVVDDDVRLRELLKRYLTAEGFRITTAADAEEARSRMMTYQFDLLILDVMMPGENGLELTRDLRQKNKIPILMLTAMGQTEARISGFEAGADDYLSKPFEPRELVLRIQSILRRLPDQGDLLLETTINLGDYIFDVERQVLSRDDTPVRLTTTEVALLSALARQPGEVMSREDLAERCKLSGQDRTIDVQVTRLRRKIEIDPRIPQFLHTVRGRGYVLRPT